MWWYKTLVCSVLIVAGACDVPKDQAHWSKLASQELLEAIKVKWDFNPAKNIILFVGDGMGPNTVTATRILKGGEGHRLVFEKFPHIGLLKTYSANKMVPDSSSTATAMFCGSKTNQRLVGLDASVTLGNCNQSLLPEVKLKSLAADALNAKKAAGFVTTMRVTHATPAPLYANCPNRAWECDAKTVEPCKDIARQMIEDWPGKDFQVILGGGRQGLVPDSTGTTEDPIDSWGCQRKDGRNLIDDYIKDKESRKLKYSYVKNNQELKNFNVEATDYLLGIFANSHLKYEFERDTGPGGMPSIVDMTEAAIKILQKNENGFFLMVEGGNIDFAHHRGRAKTAISEAAAFEDAVERAIAMTDEKDTLIVVTADHALTLSINGYPDRGNLFGIAQESRQGVNYTTLSYATGGPNAQHNYVDTTGETPVVRRRDASEDNTDDYHYEQVAGIITDETTHGGGDVTVYAQGPHAHLFHNVHEQHYVYHAIAYASGLGDYPKPTGSNAPRNTAQKVLAVCFLVLAFVAL